MTTVAEALQWATETLGNSHERTGTQEEIAHKVRSEAETLLLAITHWNRTHLLTSFADCLPDALADAYKVAVSRRASGEPLQHIIGRAPFYGRDFVVRPGCLIPRPETEVLAETAVNWIRRRRPTATVLDVGTGSGILAITLALECPQSSVHAVDISQQALAIAQENATALSAHITFHHCDALDMLAKSAADHISDSTSDRGADSTADHTSDPTSAHTSDSTSDRGAGPNAARSSAVGEGAGVWNVIVSNPPYIPSAEVSTLSEEVRLYEPRLALDGGRDGLDYYRGIRALGEAVFANGPAAVFFEVGDTQAEDVLALYRDSAGWPGWTFQVARDLRGFGRVVWGERQ